MDNTSEGRIAMVKNKTSIIIVTWNALSFFKSAVNHVRTNTPNDYELIVVDNGSRPEMVEYIKSLGCKAIFNDGNFGPGKAFNQGIDISDGEYICLLNSDADVIGTNWLNDMLITINSDASIGIVGPTCDNVSSIQNEPHRRNGDDYLIQTGYVMPFVCVLMRRDIFKTIGLIAERFTQGCSEDSEFCTRLDKSGYKKMVSAKAFVHHHLNQSYKDNNVNASEACFAMSRKEGETEEIKFLSK